MLISLNNKTTQAILIFIAISVIIILNSMMSSSGALSPDSTHYLAFAQRLIDGNSIWEAGENGHFAVWPVGYPVLIFIVSKILGLSVFVSSKVVNVIFVLASIVLILRYFPGKPLTYLLLLSFGSYLQIFSHSWSEIPFIFCLLWFCLSLSKIYSSQSTGWHLSLLFSLVALFMFRYIGAFGLLVIALLGLYKLHNKDLKGFTFLTIIGLLAFSVMAAYLYNNVQLTGWATGRERLPAFESSYGLLLMTAKGLLQELSFIIGRNKQLFWITMFVQTGILVALYITLKRRTIDANDFAEKGQDTDSITSFGYIFLLTGITYYLAIIVLRWNSHFDTLNTRLLAPGTLLILIAFVYFIRTHADDFWARLTEQMVLALSICSLLLAMWLAFNTNSIESDNRYSAYSDQIENIQDDYSAINPSAIVIFGNVHMRYLNTSLIIKRPYSHPLAKDKQPVTEYLEQIMNQYPDKVIVIDISAGIERCERLHESWCEILRQHKDKVFFTVQSGN